MKTNLTPNNRFLSIRFCDASDLHPVIGGILFCGGSTVDLTLCKAKGCRTCLDRRTGEYCNKHAIQMRRHGRITDKKLPVVDGEAWKDVPGSNGKYMVSSHGRVRSHQYGGEKIIKTYTTKRRQRVQVRMGRNTPVGVAHLTATLFKPNTYDDNRLVYLDGDRTNCRADNLEWMGVYWHDRSLKSLTAQIGTLDVAGDLVDYMRGDNKAFDRVVAARRHRLHGFISYLLSFYRDTHGVKHGIVADDIVQETCIKAMLGIKRGLLRDATGLQSWLNRIARNTLINSGRAEKPTVSENGCNSDGDEFNYIDYALSRGLDAS